MAAKSNYEEKDSAITFSFGLATVRSRTQDRRLAMPTCKPQTHTAEEPHCKDMVHCGSCTTPT